MMASEVANAILKRVSPIGDDLSNGELLTAVDAELQEVREVLESFGCPVLSGTKGLCFGVFGSSCDDREHSERCQRARQLAERLRVG